MAWQYPTNDLDKPDQILPLLGSDWDEMYEGRQMLVDGIQARTGMAKQVHQDLVEAGDALSRQKCPIYHTELWLPIRLRESEMNSTDAAMWRFDDAGLPTLDTILAFDVALNGSSYTFTRPAAMVGCPVIINRITEPSLSLQHGFDYYLDPARNALVFRQNPFDNALIAKQEIFVDGVAVDREIVLWGFQVQLDWELPYYHFGYMLDLRMPSSQGYLDVLNIIFDGIINGSSTGTIQDLVAAMTGIPVATVSGEVVVDVRRDARHNLILTDHSCYKASLNASPVVAVGDILTRGQSLTDALTILEFRRGTDISDSDLAMLTLYEGFLTPGFQGEIGFRNIRTPVVVSGAAGAERVEWALTGHPLDLTRFWDLVHERRLTYGESLYELLEGLPGGVPAEINPLQFLADHCFRNNAFVILLKCEGFGDTAAGLAPSRFLRQLLPPNVAVLLVLELPVMSDSVTMVTDGPGDSFDAMEPLTTAVTDVELGYWCKIENFTCQ